MPDRMAGGQASQPYRAMVGAAHPTGLASAFSVQDARVLGLRAFGVVQGFSP